MTKEENDLFRRISIAKHTAKSNRITIERLVEAKHPPESPFVIKSTMKAEKFDAEAEELQKQLTQLQNDA